MWHVQIVSKFNARFFWLKIVSFFGKKPDLSRSFFIIDRACYV